MGAPPTTRPSLLLRLRDLNDYEAWRQFVALYGELVYRFARSRGLQDADAADVTQIVFHTVSQEIPRLDYDPDRGLFRNWLLVVTRNQVSKYLSRMQGTNRPATYSCSDGLIDDCIAHDGEAERWEHDYRLRAFRLAADRVQEEFEDSSWQAFWRTAVEGQPAKTVGDCLGMSVGAVYTARSRVLSRVKSVIADFDEEDVPFFES
jgi:RNA polymerase sigma factor (sigma-70 family)